LKKIVLLISGRGSNMEALPATIAAVISNNPRAEGLAVAQQAGVPTTVVDHVRFADRSAFDTALAAEIDRYSPDLVVLAGFMRVLTEAFVVRYPLRMMNIHPSLLPSFPGLHTHRRALEAGVRVHGCTVHLVTPSLDSGPIIIQAAVPVLAGDDEDTLAARVLTQEHRIFPQAVRWFCEGKITVNTRGLIETDGTRQTSAALVAPDVD
jgi:phosphoribosylglycinamide formyltransferase 1